MLHALTSPTFRSIALAGLVLGGAGAAHLRMHHHTTASHRLTLHAVDQPNAFYLSVFRDGRDVRVNLDNEELRPITFEIRASVYDGCRWLGTETLDPIDDHTFAYDYSETILDCDAGAVPLRKTPRKGLVTVDSPIEVSVISGE
jgi:hypothetical protein